MNPAHFRAARWAALAAAVLLAGACGPAVTVRRLAPAPYNLGPVKTFVLAEADGPSPRDRDVVRVRLVERMDEQGFYGIEDAVPPSPDLFDLFERLFSKEARLAAAESPAEFRRRHPADVYMRLIVTDLHAYPRSRSQKKKDKEGKEYSELRHWAEAECSFQITLVDGRDGERLARFSVSHHASSPIYKEWSDSLLHSAERDAVNGAVDEALAQFTPQRVTDRLELDEDAPAAKEGIALVGDDRLREARELWEREAKRGESAGLAYNLGCVSEALGDPKAAAEYYEDAIRMGPGNERYRRAAAELQRRVADAERLRRGD